MDESEKEKKEKKEKKERRGVRKNDKAWAVELERST
jgi:hypothetical protein